MKPQPQHHRPQTQPAEAFALSCGRARFGEQTLLFGSCANDIKISGEDTGGGLSVFQYCGEVQGGPPLHLHEDQDEIYLVQDGQYLFQVGETQTLVSPGGVIFLPRGRPHAFSQVSEKGRMLFMFSPAGDMERYFRALAQLKGPPSPDEEVELFSAHGMRLVGPPIDLRHSAE
ncbi:hypothetical protein LTR94_025466 [Friedmanniomyces endolithicus]|nr:hypothetical protein LTR94_025466 [Friedmanniomyces endolithicus]